MKKNQNIDRSLIQFMFRLHRISLQDQLSPTASHSAKGYAMLVTSVISIAMFSMLAAYMTITNLSKSSTNAYVDGTNTFYAAESGLNKRAQELRDKFKNYTTPSGTVPGGYTASGSVTAASITNCFSISVAAVVSATDDFQCRNYPFKYNNNISAVVGQNGSIVLNEKDGEKNAVKYIAHTFVAPKQNYATTPPTASLIPSGETYSGLNALEYVYTVYATATKPNTANSVQPDFTTAEIEAKNRLVEEPGDKALIASYDAKQAAADAANNTNSANSSSTNSVLQMEFKSRIVPLFQFAAFYDGDLEMNSSSNMTIGGRVHTNANFYTQPKTTGTETTVFLSTITAVGSIYNRVDATVWGNANQTLSGISRVLMTGDNCTSGTCEPFPVYAGKTGDSSDPLTSLQLAAFGGNVRDGSGGVVRLNTPPPGFLRKRNYYDSWTGNIATTKNNAGEYYAKADMRLEMVPDRDVSSTTASPWTRNQAIIPFNFTSMTSVVGSADTCITTLPAKDAATDDVPTLAKDPANNYIDPDRNNPKTTGTLLNNLHCNVFTKGQLQSLRQPVMVLTDINQPNTTLRTATGTVPAVGSEAAILGRPTILTPLASLVTVSDATKAKILRALQVAIVSTPLPVKYDELGTTAVSASGFSTTFATLIDSSHISELTDTDRDNLKAATPNAIAALRNAWFLPAPIQRIESGTPVDTAVRNTRSSGFYDGRERRWITMLQTNIASLSVWNRDGLYVDAQDNTLTTAYNSTDALRDTAFNSGAGANSTNGLAFDRASTIPATPKGLQALGLGSIDFTEGGLTLHATVSDDLNGDGVNDATNDVSLDTANPIKKRDAVGNLVDADNKPLATGATGIIIDYPRKYRGGTSMRSPFGFAFNGGNYLPGALTLVTDQPIYVQGDFNNNGKSQSNIAPTAADTNRLPASIIGDVITVLSNQCLANSSATSVTDNITTGIRANHLGVPASQLRCGLPKGNTGSINIPVGTNDTASQKAYPVTSPTAVNAAFLSNTQRSIGNLGLGRGWTSDGTAKQFSGAVNNYMRMLESWGNAGGQFFNYSGSLVSLGTPIEASGAYASGVLDTGYYTIPQRNFNFDKKFLNFSTLPPLTPRAIYLQQNVFKRNYN